MQEQMQARMQAQTPDGLRVFGRPGAEVSTTGTQVQLHASTLGPTPPSTPTCAHSLGFGDIDVDIARHPAPGPRRNLPHPPP